MTELNQETRNLIENTVNHHLNGYEVFACNIEAYETSQGEEAISVGVCYTAGQNVLVDPEALTSLLTELNLKLLGIGETRFPYIRHYLGEGHNVSGNWNVCGADSDSQEAHL